MSDNLENTYKYGTNLLQCMFNTSNSNKKNDISSVLQGFYDIEKEAITKGVIPSDETKVTDNNLNKLLKIEGVLEKSGVKKLLENKLQLNIAKKQKLSETLKTLVNSKDGEVKDFIGG